MVAEVMLTSGIREAILSWLFIPMETPSDIIEFFEI